MHGRSSSLATIKIYHNEFCGLTTYKKKYAHFDLVYLLYLSLLIFKRKGHMFVLTLKNADSGILENCRLLFVYFLARGNSAQVQKGISESYAS